MTLFFGISISISIFLQNSISASIENQTLSWRIHCLPMESNSSSPNTIPVFSTLASPFDENTDSNRKPLSLWPGMYHSPVTNALWETRSKIFETLLDPPIHAPPQSQLLTKKPSDSRTSILYNFSTDFILREQYRDPWNEVRIGKLLEDLDALAGTISVKVHSFSYLLHNTWTFFFYSNAW